MKRAAKITALIIAVMIAAAMIAIPAHAEITGSLSSKTVTATDGKITIGDKTYYKVSSLNSGQEYLIVGENGSGTLTALTYKDGSAEALVWSTGGGGGGGGKSGNNFAIDKIQLTVKDGELALKEKSSDKPPKDENDPSGGDPSDKPSDKPSGGGGDKPSGGGNKPPGGGGGDKPSGGGGGDKPSGGGGGDKPSGGGGGGGSWDYNAGVLSYSDGKTTYYMTFSGGAFGVSEKASDAGRILLFCCGDTLGRIIDQHPGAVRYVIEGSGYEAPEFAVSLLNNEITIDALTWYIDDEAQECGELTFRADPLADKPAGLYSVCCEVSGHDGDFNYYREKSAKASFIVTSGVKENTLLTFSDVHEEFDNIGKAIKEFITGNGGMIPSLIVCTGDWNNGGTASAEKLQKECFPKMKAQMGGIDTVYVSGNHEDSAASAALTISCGLGADAGFSDGIGVIFDSRSADVRSNGSTGVFAEGLIVYGLNYGSVETETDGSKSYSYDAVYKQLKTFLSELAKDYHGELILISSHAGLHVLGVQPESAASETSEWSGKGEYNVDKSYDVASLLNSYAKDKKMNIMFMFGHDHSKEESEFLLTPGSSLTSTKSYADKTSGTQVIDFTYGHAGYLSGKIGGAKERYSVISWDDSTVTIDRFRLGKDETETAKIAKATVTESAADIILGDADGDMEVTILDATTIRRKLVGLATTSFLAKAADADGDGDMTILDATAIQRYLAELSFPEGIGSLL